MCKERLRELTPEEIEKYVSRHRLTISKLEILKNLITRGAILSDIKTQFLEKALREIEDEDLRIMLSLLAENERQREAMYMSKLERFSELAKDLILQDCCDSMAEALQREI